MSSSTPAFPKLSSTNYNLWSGDMEAWLRAQGLWRIVAGLSLRPTTPASPGDAADSPASIADTATLALQESWDAKSDKAAGWIWLMLEQDQKTLACELLQGQSCHHVEDPSLHLHAAEGRQPLQRL